MEQSLIIGVVASIAVVSLLPLLVLHMSRRRQDEYLISFYNACNDLRDHIHTSTSRAEVIELFDDIVNVEESFNDLIPRAVLDKEIKLLDTLLIKKSKKLK
jgi:hypothetical protein